MGYRSDVAYSIGFEDKATLNEFIALIMVKGGEDLQALKECAVDTNDEINYYRVNAFFDDVKWYDSFPDVQAHHRLMNFALERFEDKVGWRFIRVGEEYDDIQDDSAGESNLIDYDMYVSRTLEMPHNTDPIGDSLALIP